MHRISIDAGKILIDLIPYDIKNYGESIRLCLQLVCIVRDYCYWFHYLNPKDRYLKIGSGTTSGLIYYMIYICIC